MDGGDEKRVLPLGDVEPARYVSWLPPNGDELVFLGHPHGYLDEIGLYRIRPDGTGLTQIALQRGELLPGVDTRQDLVQDMTFSDDGKTAAYWNWETAISPDKECFTHLMDLTTGEDRRMSFDPSAGCELLPRLLGDGRILLERQDNPTGTAQLLVAPVDGSGPATTIGERYNATHGWDLSPDRAEVIFAADLGPGMLISTDTGAVEQAHVRTSGPAQLAAPRTLSARAPARRRASRTPAGASVRSAADSLTFVPYPARATSVSP